MLPALDDVFWALPLVAVLSQFLFYRWLQAHYRRCDLA